MSEFFNYRLTKHDMNILGIPKPNFSEFYARLPADPRNLFLYCLTFNNAAKNSTQLVAKQLLMLSWKYFMTFLLKTS
jgi:hypothetical protein